MPVTKFPDPRRAPADGLLAVGGDLRPERLLSAYSQGIFPWPVYDPDEDESILAWFCPDPRGILRFSELHVPESLRRARRKTAWRFTVDQAFEQVILACSQAPRPGQAGTWITPEMMDAYIEFHRLGHAHSVEVWEGPKGREELVGGIYGVEVGGVFAGESMFHQRPNASKLALLHLFELLKKGGASWIDIQMLTPHMKALGAREISRDDFLKELSRTRALGLRLFHPSQDSFEP